MKALWLTTWFPDRLVFHNGDFVERYARAVSTRVFVVVLYVAKDPNLRGDKTEIDIETHENLIIIRGYYGMDSSSPNLISRVGSAYKYFKMFNRLYKRAVADFDTFDIVHVQVAFRAGIFALWLKMVQGIDYVNTEHSSWFMPPAYLFKKAPAITRWITKKIFRNAKAVHVVSNRLGQELKDMGMITKAYTVIPNVVDTGAFYPSTLHRTNDIFQFVTITGNIHQKNTEGVIRAFGNFLHRGYSGMLHVIGSNDDSLKALTSNLALSPHVIFHGAIKNTAVAEVNRRCDAMIFFSRYETFGVALVEANCCGVPVIASRLPVIEETILDGVNGIFVEPENEAELTDKMIHICRHYAEFDKEAIAKSARDKYNYNNVAAQFESWYKTNLNC